MVADPVSPVINNMFGKRESISTLHLDITNAKLDSSPMGMATL
jgi:hypothetical protein